MRIKISERLSLLWLCCLLFGLTLMAQAQQGPELPCVDCPAHEKLKPFPSTGSWWNPQQSGTGMMLEFRQGMMVGYYLLYEDDGEPVWYTMIGNLEPAEEEEDIEWVLEAELERYTGGACVNCPHDFPELDESPGTIRFEFIHRNFARFSVNDGPTQNIVPMPWGNEILTSPIFEPYSDFLLSWGAVDTWALVFERLPGLSSLYDMLPVRFMSFKEDDETFTIPLGIELSDFFIPLGEITCFRGGEFGPFCEMELSDSAHERGFIAESFTRHPYRIFPGDIGHNRIQGEGADGRTIFTAFPLNYD